MGASEKPASAQAGTGGGDSTGASFAVAAPSLSLPKGGGAIRGMGEKFAANPVTGTGSMSVPIATSPGRGGFGPQLSLAYDSGAGNGIFGLGWNLSLPAITRKTDKGLPRYCDAEESDVFILSGAEDLVPLLDSQGKRIVDTQSSPGFAICRYRPRIEGLFARIERWTSTTDASDVRWRSISKDNITSWYGRDAGSRIADAADPAHIFTWLLCASVDDKGNAIVYEYAAENSANVDLASAHERNRTPAGRAVNRHIKHIKYGNKTSLLVEPDIAKLDWHFQVLFDYGENHYREYSVPGADPFYVEAWSAPPQPAPWPCRADPFSSHRAGFEVRSYRLCRRVLMFHDFVELGATPCLVGSTDFSYTEGPVASFMTAVSHAGYVHQRDAGGAWLDRYLKKSLPPLEFTYSEAPAAEQIPQLPVAQLDRASLANLPIGLDGHQYQWVDLDGEGIAGVLSEQPGGWYYKDNLGEGRFGAARALAELGSLAAPGGRHQLLDLDGDGQLDLTLLEAPAPGFYARTADAAWEPFRSFRQLPNVAWNDPNLKFLDVTGDGHADVVISEDRAIVWHASLAKEGFAPAERVARALDEERGPHLLFADGSETVFLSDMSGDGLTDIVRIRNGEVCYWPNLGYGRFGAKIAMDNAPRFDTPDQFDPRRIRLADVDGSGTTDIVYLGREAARLYCNRSGNGWSDAVALPQLPRTDNVASVQTVDLLGRGTACLVWSSPLPGDAARPLRYIDLMAGQKPHLLVKTVNNLGTETRVSYLSSTHFYLADKAAGKPWITKLPFPVHVVERVETFDRISNNRFVTRYAYHHGCFDGVEREFRGFGMVEQWDTEAFTALSRNDDFMNADNIDPASHVPPAYTKTWFHTGLYLGRERVSNYFAGLLDDKDVGEYYIPHRSGDAAGDAAAKALLLEDTILPSDLTLVEEREACRALKGAMLRQEVYALDGSAKQDIPYAVTEQNFTIECLQGQGINRHAVFFTHPREALSYHYERDPDDARVGHSMVLQVDAYGNVLKSLAIGYGRTPGKTPLTLAWDQARQERLLVTYSENDTTNAIDDIATWPDVHRTPLPAEARTYEITGLQPAPGKLRFAFDDFAGANLQRCAGLEEIFYEARAEPGKEQKRLIERQRTLYRKDDLSALLKPGQLESLAIAGEAYKLAFTPGLLQQVYVRNGVDLLGGKPEDILAGGGGDRGGYVDLDSDGHWWIPSGRAYLSPGSTDDTPTELAHAREHFFLPCRYRDPFYTDTWNTESRVSYDAYDLFPVQTVDTVGNSVQAEHDYRVLQAHTLTDPNGNRSRAAFDALGLVVATAVMGKVAPAKVEGDLLEGFDPDSTLAALQNFIADPVAHAAGLLGLASTRVVYDLDRYRRCGEPSFAASLARETHVADEGGVPSKIQFSFSYSDGFGREIQKKIQAEPGDAPQREANATTASGDIAPGALLLNNGQPVLAASNPRWVGNGRTVFNNKGKPVRQYEPFFSSTHLYEPERELTDTGVSPTLFYDPLGRVVATLHPNNTYAKVLFDPWQQTSFDVNDTVTGDPRTDADIAGYVAVYFQTQPPNWQTWFQQRTVGTLAANGDEKDAADKTAAHADTPAVAHADALGRPFLTFAHNRTNGADELYPTRVELDIEGNQRSVRDAVVQQGDALGRVVMLYANDMLGNRIHQLSMEAGARWMLNDITGKPLRGWNSRMYELRSEFDLLRRPVRSYVQGGDPSEEPPTVYSTPILVERTVYGDDPIGAGLSPTQLANANLRGKPYRHYDNAGVVTSDLYDFKGNPVRGSRQITQDYKQIPDWSRQPAPVLADSFETSSRFDALNRPTYVTAPDKSVYHAIFNEANLLEQVEVNLRGAGQATSFVTNINYNAKGQRTLIEYANGAKTRYTYDPLTFRLVNLKTRRQPGPNGNSSDIFEDPAVVQDIAYTFDPVGNITRLQDAALRTIFYNNAKIDARCDYTYDAIYRLIAATGREHAGQMEFLSLPTNGSLRDVPFVGAGNQNDLQALRNYTQRYDYDAVGNFLHMVHQVAGGGWARKYQYADASLTEPGKKSNRLSRTTLSPNGVNPIKEPYTHDAHGNMLSMPSLILMRWDYRDQMCASSRQVVTNGIGETTYYLYDAAGQRVRKVTETASHVRKSERIYLGGFEVYRECDGSGTTVTLERETLHVIDDKQRIALVETKTQDTQKPHTNVQPVIRYQIGNHLGSASAELDVNGALISYEEYHPYGTTAYQALGNAEVSLKRYRYTGMERDEETGFSYHGMRYYASWLGNWTACDRIGIQDHPNLFCYARRNPVTGTDLTGRKTIRPEDVNGLEDAYRAKNVAESSGERPAGSCFKQEELDKLSDEQQKLVLHAQDLDSSLSTTPPQIPGPSLDIDTHAKDRESDQMDRDFFSFDLDPDKVTLPDAVMAFYEVGYEFKQAFYKPLKDQVKDIVAPETTTFLGASGKEIQFHVKPDPAKTVIAAAGIALIAIPELRLGLGPQTPTAYIRYSGAMLEASPADANFLRFGAEWAQEEGPLVRGTRADADAQLRGLSRDYMDSIGFDRLGLQAMHPLDSAAAGRFINPGSELGTTYYYGSASANQSFGAQLGREFTRLRVKVGGQFWLEFVDFPSYDLVPPIAPPSSPPNLKW